MQNVKHDFQVANQEISFGNVCMIQNGFTIFDRNSCLMQGVQFPVFPIFSYFLSIFLFSPIFKQKPPIFPIF